MYIVGIAAALVGVVGIVIGLLLGVAGEVFKVEEDPREVEICGLLPGNNCGGCGYAGCSALAKAIVAGEAPVNGCPVCKANTETIGKISDVMGVEAVESARTAAFVKCSGTCDKAEIKFNYYGIEDCKKAMTVPGAGNKMCASGCLGLGTCVKACAFDAIHIIDGVSVVDRDKCAACGKCVEVCPKNIIELLPYDARNKVACSNHDKGKAVKTVCSAGCIACGVCVKQCEAEAIKLENNLPVIDYEKCTGCGKCVEECPRKIIK